MGLPGCVVEVFATTTATDRYAALAAAAPRWTLVEDRALAALSDSVTPAGVVAVCRFVDRPLEHVLDPTPADGPARAPDPAQRGAGLVAICADVRDPGNAGTVVRTADAAGADAVVVAGSAVDLYNPKTLRAAVGSTFHLPVAVAPDAGEAVRAAQARGMLVLAAAGDGEVDLFAADELLSAPTAWLFGNEAHGLPDELGALADHRVRIPVRGRAESLNLATAAAVCLYASARARTPR